MTRRPKLRPRGESDLGRPNTVYNGRPRTLTGTMMLKRTGSWIGTPKASTGSQLIAGVIMPLPWMIGSLSYQNTLANDSSTLTGSGTSEQGRIVNTFIHACAISAASLIAIAVVKTVEVESDHSQKQLAAKRAALGQTTPFSIQMHRASRTISALLIPMFYAMQFGSGISTALLLIIFHSCGLAFGSDIETASIWLNYKGRLSSCTFILIFSVAFGLSGASIWGYGLLLLALLWAPNPLLQAHAPVSNGAELSHTFLAGASLGGLTIIGILFSPQSVSFTLDGFITFLSASATTTASIIYIEPRHFYNKSHVAISIAVATTFLISSFSIHNASSFIFNVILSAACFAGALYDSGDMFNANRERKAKLHNHVHGKTDCSRFTLALLEMITPGSIIHSILLERDSRRIAYFGVLNLAFMVVQFSYGFLTGSLGLLTDSIHMLFDCIGLAVGLAAAVMSKWPPTAEFPYGYSKIDTLSGFANGIFLILVSVEIVFDALHRLREGYEIRRLNELLVVSILGFLVNIVGLAAFGHAHHHGHGHDHGHSHGHTHSNSHDSHSHAHSNSNDHSHQHKHTHKHQHKHEQNHNRQNSNGSLGHTHRHSNSTDSKSKLSGGLLPPFGGSPKANAGPKSHTHDHSNENMQGIFLHILADALGSVAVIISTILTKFNSWHGWDPLASCLIAILIFFSAIPLVKRSGSKLLLSLSDEAEYSCRGVLQGISELRGVQGYAGVRLWMADKESQQGHSHSHGHDHSHDHHHDSHHGQGHDAIHEHPHEHHEDKTYNPKSPVTILGVIHIVAASSTDIDDVRDRVEQYFRSRGMDIVVHVEKEGDARCWCGVGMRNSLGSPLKSTFG